MSTTVRRSVALTKPQYQFLEQEAERLGITIADVIRRIIDQYREERPRQLPALRQTPKPK